MESSKLTSRKEFIIKFAEVQRNMKCKKSKRNTFGKYNYRNCEDIFEGANKVLDDLVLTVTDELLVVGDRFYIKATATVTDGDNEISNSAFAREAISKKGMDDAMVTGASSSYARKYALNGLFCIDDTADVDHDSFNANYSKAKEYPAMEIINKAISTKDYKYISENWSGTIAGCWSQLNNNQIESLNNIINKTGK